MFDGPFGRPGRWWRGCLHAHSDRSDGALSPAEVVERYCAAGYDFLALTDHFTAEYGFPLTDTRAWRTADFTTLLAAELHAPRTMLSDEWHIVAVGLPLGFAPPVDGEDGPALARRARAAGAFVGIAHPAASLLHLADAVRLDAAHAVEAHNAVAAGEGRADSWHLYDLLLAAGHRLTAYAADDAHFSPQDPPGCTSWVTARATALAPDALLAALRAGDFYSSTGPCLLDVRRVGDRLTVRCSPVRRIVVTGGVPGKQLCVGDRLTSGVVELDERLSASPYVRVTVIAADGTRAWSNPMWRPQDPTEPS